MKIKKLGLILVSLVIFSFMIVGVQATDGNVCTVLFTGYDNANNCVCSGASTNLQFTSSTFGDCLSTCSFHHGCDKYFFVHVAGVEGTFLENMDFSGWWTLPELHVILFGMFLYDDIICDDGPAEP